MFLYNLLSELRSRTSITLHSQNGNQNVIQHFIPNNAPQVLNGRNGMFGPFRFPFKYDLIKDWNVLLHLRDPRDVLTSLFYSVTASHKDIPNEKRNYWLENGIDEFVLKYTDIYLPRYKGYCNYFLDKENVRFLKYEDLIEDSSGWLDTFVDHIPYEFDKALFKKEMNSLFLSQTNIEEESPHKLIRQVVPGDYQRKLNSNTIDILNSKFNHILKDLKYSN